MIKKFLIVIQILCLLNLTAFANADENYNMNSTIEAMINAEYAGTGSFSQPVSSGYGWGDFHTFSGEVQCPAEEIEVFINGKKIEFDVKPIMISNRVMVPVRKIFETFGADVQWVDISQTCQVVDARCGDKKVLLQVGYNQISVNDIFAQIDVAPIIKDSRVLVPLRAVSEAFEAEVAWDEKNNRVLIEVPYLSDELKPIRDVSLSPDKCIIPFEDDVITYNIKDNILFVSGKTDWCDATGKTLKISIEWRDDAKSMLYVWGFPVDVDVDGVFEYKLNLNDFEIIKDCYVGIIYLQEKDMFSAHKALHIEKNVGAYLFDTSVFLSEWENIVWKHNKEIISKWVNPIGYLNITTKPIITRISDEICNGATDDYEKINRISTWVAENIYYDFDSDMFDRYTEIADVLKYKRTVCEGYANLVQALIQAQNIPCQKVSGYAHRIDVEFGYWCENNVNIEYSNHAWNRAYVNGRWINIDATWNSRNRYANGQYLAAECVNNYFDISDLEISKTHKILSLNS